MDNVKNKKIEAIVAVDHPWLAILPLLMGSFVGMFSETALNIALPQLMKALNVNESSVQLLVTGYMLVIGIVLPLSGLLTKWFTTRQLTIFGLVIFILGSLISGISNSFALVLVGRMIQGIGTGIVLPLMFTVAMLIFPANKLGTVNGILGLVIMFAPAIGPVVTGFILAAFSWKAVFYSFAIILLIGLIIALFAAKNIGQLSKPKIDFLSIIYSIIAFSGLIVGASLASYSGWTSPQVLALLIVGAIVLVLYIRRQLIISNPVLNLRVFKYRNFMLGAILMMLDFGMNLSIQYLLPQYLQNGLVISVALTGIVMLPGGLVTAITSAIAGRLYDSFGAKWPARAGFFITAIGAIMFAFTTTESPIWYVILAHIIVMIGAPLALSPSQTSALNTLKGPESADGSAILNTLQQVVGALVTAVVTSFLTVGRNSVNGSTSFKFTTGFHYGIYVTIAIAVVGLVVALFEKDNGHND